MRIAQVEFARWKRSVDFEISKRVGGLTADDLPDVDYWSMWQEGKTPKQAAGRAIKNAMEV